ncbi:MAG: AI-2E family transporter [Bacteroidetes bacterium]|nr:AI-2E family transporter [Bacteroidota bacterium]
MKTLYQEYHLFFIIITILIVGFIAWYFSNIVAYILIAVVVSFLGQPIVHLLEKIHIGKFRIPRAITALVALLLILFVFIVFFSLFIPLAVKQATIISTIDPNALLDHYKSDIDWLQDQLLRYGVLPEHTTLGAFLTEKIKSILNLATFSNLLGNLLSITGGLVFSLFSILFLGYFFLYDENLFMKILLALMPDKYDEQTRNVTIKSKTLLSRYFIGLVADVIIMIISYIIGLSLIGVKGAVVIGIFGGIVNIIPYIGPIIATVTGVLLGVTSAISAGEYVTIIPLVIKILVVFISVILLDNVLYAPVIYGKSINAHPVEIFIVIIAAGSIGGIIGMIIAVPVYSLLRIIAKEFLSQFRLVQKMTNRLD